MNYCPDCGNALHSRLIDGHQRDCCERESCGFIAWNNPVPVIAVLVEYQGQILLARNAAWPKGTFSLITGFLESGENPDECALRELKEELGLSGQVISLIGYYLFQPKNQLILAFHVRAEGKIELNDELAEFRLIQREKLRPWDFGTGLAVRDWLVSQGLAAHFSPTPNFAEKPGNP